MSADLTTVPITLGFWIARVPFARPQVWPFCRWVALAVDHFSRRVMGFSVLRGEPSSEAVRRFLEGVFKKAGHQSRHMIFDRGIQFTAKGFRRWCRRGILRLFGAVGKHGIRAVIQPCIRTLKTECTRRLILVPLRLAAFRQELRLYLSWYNGERPHSRPASATPDEVYHGHRRPSRRPRFEPRPRSPGRSPCASPQTLVTGQPGVPRVLGVSRHPRRQHLLPVPGAHERRDVGKRVAQAVERDEEEPVARAHP